MTSNQSQIVNRWYCTREYGMRKIASIFLLVALASCGRAELPAVQPPAAGATGVAAAATSVVQPAGQPTAPPPATAPPTAAPAQMPTAVAQAPDTLVRAAQQFLAARLGVRADTLKLQSATAQEWRDGSLGCPQ